MSRRTTIEIDDALLGRAQAAALGTTGLKDTVDAALRAAVGGNRHAHAWPRELHRARVSTGLKRYSSRLVLRGDVVLRRYQRVASRGEAGSR